tara:strand:- start:229 stop:615 length:387 start_codon:yes stop_codon:yes gene_type:complete
LTSLLLALAFFGQQYNCLSENVYYEARNQPFIGQVAVADVTLNRVNSNRWPDTPCAVVKQRKQFSWTLEEHEKPTGKAWKTAQKAVLVSLLGPDRTKGATHFHATYVTPYWAAKQKVIVTIGDHIFYV